MSKIGNQDPKIIDMVEKMVDRLNDINYNLDLNDVGNEIGTVIGEYIDGTMGYTKDVFIDGLNHGISLVDGTHG